MGTFCIGIDIGKTHFRVGLLNEQSELVDFRKTSFERTGYERFLDSVTASIDECLALIGGSGADVGAIGVALPGIVSRENGALRHALDFDFMTGRSITDDLSSRYSCAVTSDVDTIAATWGELSAGIGRECDRFALLTWGTSIGAGLVLDGKVIAYPDDLFPEFGHIKVSDDERPCICGGSGCFASMASGQGIAVSGREAAENDASEELAAIVRRGGGPVTAANVFDAADAGDAGARQILNRVGELFGRMYASLVYFCQPEKIVVTGGLTARFSSINAAVRIAMRKNCWLLAGGFTSCEPVMSTLGDTAGVIGSAAQARAKLEETT
ncbi:MAG: ROK family protein [Spirochaetales bacterium]|jgi:glucokinase|nr:ROK family protein [Spirochaetales bacterium]